MSDPTQQLDTNLLDDYLSTALPELGKIIESKKFGIGQSNPTFWFKTNTGEFVLRRQPPGELLKSAHAVDREYRVMHALRDTAVPVPRVYHLCEDRDVLGSKFFIMDFANGEQHANPALESVEKENREGYFYEVVDKLAALHKLDIKKIGMEDFGKGDNFFSRQIELWTRQYRAAETDNRPDMETLISKLPELLPADDNTKSLTHGDYKFDNVIFAKGEPRLLAILDWELSTIGHPMADFAYFLMNLRLPQMAMTKGLGGMNLKEECIPHESELITRYCQQTESPLVLLTRLQRLSGPVGRAFHIAPLKRFMGAL